MVGLETRDRQLSCWPRGWKVNRTLQAQRRRWAAAAALPGLCWPLTALLEPVWLGLQWQTLSLLQDALPLYYLHSLDTPLGWHLFVLVATLHDLVSKSKCPKIANEGDLQNTFGSRLFVGLLWRVSGFDGKRTTCHIISVIILHKLYKIYFAQSQGCTSSWPVSVGTGQASFGSSRFNFGIRRVLFISSP